MCVYTDENIPLHTEYSSTHIKGASSLAFVEFGAFGAINSVLDVVRLAVELFGNVHLGFRSFDADVGADEGARFAFLLVARSGSWCSGGWLPKLTCLGY